MNTHTWHFDLHSNMSQTDKLIRYGLVIVLFALTLTLEISPMGWFVIAPLIAVPILASAIIGWDPLYALFQKLPIPKLPLKFNKMTKDH